MPHLARVILTTKHRADTGRKLSRIERLAEIIIGADLKTDDTVDVLLQCGEKNDRNKRILGSHIPTDFQAGSVRQHDIEHDQLDIVRLKRGLQCALVRRQRYPKSLLGQISAKQLSNLEVIIDYQDVGFDVHSLRPHRNCPRPNNALAHDFQRGTIQITLSSNIETYCSGAQATFGH